MWCVFPFSSAEKRLSQYSFSPESGLVWGSLRGDVHRVRVSLYAHYVFGKKQARAQATYNVISENCLSTNTVSLHTYNADLNSIFENNMTNNWRSIAIGYSRNNKFYHNYFFNDTWQILVLASGYANFWDNDYPSGGNYWSDYEERYPDAEELGGSGVWNTPYVIGADNQDNYAHAASNLRNPTYRLFHTEPDVFA